MNLRFIVLGILFVAIGVFFILYPVALASPSHVSEHTKLVRVAPGNYSFLQTSLGPHQTLSVSLTSSPKAVDFFLMNSTSFSSWAQKGNPPTDIYPQYSKFNATKYSFTVTGGATNESYTLILLSQTVSTPSNVQVQLAIDDQTSFFQANAVPIILLVCGIALAVFGATRRKEVVEGPPEEEPQAQGGGLMGLFGGAGGGASTTTRRCRYCGASVDEGAAFCQSCHRSQP